MFRKSLLCALMISALTLPAHADWIKHKNSDLAGTGVYGWSVSVPDTWTQIPDVKPAWPQGAGYAAPGGQSSIVISKTPRPTDAEQKQLCKRGYVLKVREVKAYRMMEFTKNNDGTTSRLLYMTTPRGEYRIEMTFGADSEADMEKILKSFTFINAPNAKAAAPWPSFTGPEQTFRMDYPQGCQATVSSNGFQISKNGNTLMRGTLYENSNPPAQSFRGMARQLGMHFKPDGAEPAKFSPYEIGSITAYEIMGQQTDSAYYGPLIYIPLRHSKWKVLECYLEDQNEASDFFRIVNTFKYEQP